MLLVVNKYIEETRKPFLDSTNKNNNTANCGRCGKCHPQDDSYILHTLRRKVQQLRTAKKINKVVVST